MSQRKSRLIGPGNVFPIFYCPVLVSLVFCCWSPSASGFNVLCVRDGILHILIVTSGYLSYCCLSIISNQSAHSPLTSDINKAFSSTQLPLIGYFLFFRPFSVNPIDGCAWKLIHKRNTTVFDWRCAAAQL